MTRTQAAAIGALWGLGAAGLPTPRLDAHAAHALLAAGAVLGALAATLAPKATALQHPVAAALAAACGLFMNPLPEPTFFLLVPLIAAGASWPIGRPPEGEEPSPRWVLPASFALAAGVFFFQSAHRHWTYASGSKDLGLFVQTHWLIAHGQPLVNTVMGMHVLADHMELVDFLVAPLFRIHEGAETLLFVQAVGVASGVFPLFWLGRKLLGRERWALALAWVWLLAPDVHMGVMFDYNPAPLASAGLLWTAWALLSRGPVTVLLAALFTCACKTDFPLYVAVLAGVLAAMRSIPWSRGVVVAALALALFTLEIKVVVPWFREEGFRHWEFEDLGETPAGIALASVTRPDRAAALLVDHPQKRRALLVPLVATGYVGLADPVSLLLQLPNWGERFLSTHKTRWWGYYYGTPAAALACVGLLLGWRRLAEAKAAGAGLPAYVLGSALLAGLVPPYKTHDGLLRGNLYFSRLPYASPPEDVRTQEEAVAFIGADPRLRVAAQYNLLPHLATRPFVVMLDRAAEADVVALQLDGGTWPEGRAGWRRRVKELWAAGGFHVAFCRGQTVVLCRGGGQSIPCPRWEAMVGDTPSRDRWSGAP